MAGILGERPIPQRHPIQGSHQKTSKSIIRLFVYQTPPEDPERPKPASILERR
jgi:hypothetical protein